MRVLCLSNGHGEDAIALRILRELQQQPTPPELAALPIVGEGHAYRDSGISLIGSVKTMPSGGFIYQDGRQLARDIRGGLLQLTLAQHRAIRAWATTAETQRRRDTESQPPSLASPASIASPAFLPPDSRLPTPDSLILAVGDIVPLLFARLSGLPYAFVGTAKSEYYLRDEAGWLPRRSWWDDRLERWTGCIYHPWERWLMSHPNCKAVFPRDTITANSLKQRGIPAFDLGNPMMDGLAWDGEKLKDKGLRMKEKNQALAFSLQPLALTIALLPGSRPPEAYANWETMLQAMNGMMAQMARPLVFLAAIASELEREKLRQMLVAYRWQQVTEDTYAVGLGDRRSTLVLAHRRFAECLQRADVAIAMAGTATEQFVGLGKPAIIMPGKGPQFTPGFAEAQTRLLGASVMLVKEPDRVAAVIQSLLQNPDALQTIAENGRRRMGTPGAAKRIAQCLMELNVNDQK